MPTLKVNLWLLFALATSLFTCMGDLTNYEVIAELEIFEGKVSESFDASCQRRFSVMNDDDYVAIIQVQPVKGDSLPAGKVHLVIAGIVGPKRLIENVQYDVVDHSRNVIGAFILRDD